MEEAPPSPEPQPKQENRHRVTIDRLLKTANDKLKIVDNHVNQIREKPSLVIRDATIASGTMLVAHGLWTLFTGNNDMLDALESNNISNFLPINEVPDQVYSIAEVGTGIRMMGRTDSNSRPQVMSNSEMVFRLIRGNITSFLNNAKLKQK